MIECRCSFSPISPPYCRSGPSRTPLCALRTIRLRSSGSGTNELAKLVVIADTDCSTRERPGRRPRPTLVTPTHHLHKEYMGIGVDGEVSGNSVGLLTRTAHPSPGPSSVK